MRFTDMLSLGISPGYLLQPRIQITNRNFVHGSLLNALVLIDKIIAPYTNQSTVHIVGKYLSFIKENSIRYLFSKILYIVSIP